MALLWAGQTKTDARSIPTPGALATIAQIVPGVGHWEVVLSVGYGSVALGANDTAANWQLALAWSGGGRGGSPTTFKIIGTAVINSMTPMLLIRDIEILPDMVGPYTLTIQNINAATTATYVAFLAATPFSL
jgi:hypothetical protein